MIKNGQKVRAKLKNLVIENLGLVDRGANQEAAMVIAKRAAPDGTSGNGAQILKVVFKEPSHA